MTLLYPNNLKNNLRTISKQSRKTLEQSWPSFFFIFFLFLWFFWNNLQSRILKESSDRFEGDRQYPNNVSTCPAITIMISSRIFDDCFKILENDEQCPIFDFNSFDFNPFDFNSFDSNSFDFIQLCRSCDVIGTSSRCHFQFIANDEIFTIEKAQHFRKVIRNWARIRSWWLLVLFFSFLFLLFLFFFFFSFFFFCTIPESDQNWSGIKFYVSFLISRSGHLFWFWSFRCRSR